MYAYTHILTFTGPMIHSQLFLLKSELLAKDFCSETKHSTRGSFDYIEIIQHVCIYSHPDFYWPNYAVSALYTAKLLAFCSESQISTYWAIDYLQILQHTCIHFCLNLYWPNAAVSAVSTTELLAINFCSENRHSTDWAV